MNYLICDDEPAAAESLKAKIAELEPDSSVRIFTTLQALLFNIEDIAGRIDGVFMDIKLRNANGISGAARLLASHPEIKLVYITGYASEYIQELYCVDSKALPAAILTKPIEMKYLRNALSKIHEREKQAELYVASFDEIELRTADFSGQIFDWRELTELHLPLLGEHQLHNAAVALTAVSLLRKRGWQISDHVLRVGLAGTA